MTGELYILPKTANRIEPKHWRRYFLQYKQHWNVSERVLSIGFFVAFAVAITFWKWACMCREYGVYTHIVYVFPPFESQQQRRVYSVRFSSTAISVCLFFTTKRFCYYYAFVAVFTHVIECVLLFMESKCIRVYGFGWVFECSEWMWCIFEQRCQKN